MLKRERENKNRLLIKYTVIFGILSESDIYYTLQKKTIKYSLLQSLYALNAIEQIEKQVKMTHKPEFLLNRYCCFDIFVFSLVQLGWTGKVNMVFNRLKIGAKYYIVGGLLLVFLISLFSLNFHLWECGCCWNRLPGEKKITRRLMEP